MWWDEVLRFVQNFNFWYDKKFKRYCENKNTTWLGILLKLPELIEITMKGDCIYGTIVNGKKQTSLFKFGSETWSSGQKLKRFTIVLQQRKKNKEIHT